jgi:hypothetical protein
MKTLSLLAGLLFVATGLFAQNYLLLENGTSCSLHVQLYASDPGNSCANSSYANYVVGPGVSLPATAPTGTEWVYAEVVGWPLAGCTFGQALDTDGYPTCVSCPGYGAPTSALVMTGGCNGCPSKIKMLWTAYCSSGPGHIHFY